MLVTAGRTEVRELLAAGVSPRAIERKLAAVARYLPDVQRPLAVGVMLIAAVLVVLGGLDFFLLK